MWNKSTNITFLLFSSFYCNAKISAPLSDKVSLSTNVIFDYHFVTLLYGNKELID